MHTYIANNIQSNGMYYIDTDQRLWTCQLSMRISWHTLLVFCTLLCWSFPASYSTDPKGNSNEL